MRKTDTHLFFYGSIYSQWANTPFWLEGQKFSNSEQYMMYKKAQHFKDDYSLDLIKNETNPKRVKALGRKVQNFDPTEWDKVALDYVIKGNIAKFTKNEDCLEQLLKDKDLIIVEASPFDKIWGIGLGECDDRCLDESKWLGQNKLGIAIMRAREDILKDIEKGKYFEATKKCPSCKSTNVDIDQVECHPIHNHITCKDCGKKFHEQGRIFGNGLRFFNREQQPKNKTEEYKQVSSRIDAGISDWD